MPRIPQPFLDDLLNRIDIVDLIDSRVTLKPAGKNYQARCPFHNEKTPSFSVNREKQFYHCFGCGAKGDAIGFLMEYDRMDFLEAVDTLADRAGVTVPREAAQAAADTSGTDRDLLYRLNARAAAFYHAKLTPDSAAAAYLQRRGINAESIEKYQLGYAPSAWQNFPDRAYNQTAADMQAAGLFVKHESGRVYDRFRDRIMFPIRDRRGRVVGFGGRALDDQTPKYLNSPETDIFTKHREVYGLHELLETHHRPPCIIVVEGNIDVIMLSQHGITNAVATLGTAISAEQIELLFRHTSEIVFCMDGDKAGQTSQWKALETALPCLREGRSIKFITLPEGHDPDSFVRKFDNGAFDDAIELAMPLSEYFFTHLTQTHDITRLEGKAALHKQASALINQLPGGAFRDLMTNQLASTIQYSPAPVGKRKVTTPKNWALYAGQS